MSDINHEVLDEPRQQIISHNLRFGYVATNGVASVTELITGLATGDVARTVDGAHGTAEIYVGNAQMKDAHETAHVHDSRRKKIYQCLFGFSLIGAGIAAGDMTHMWQFGVESQVLDTIGVSASAVSAGSGIAAASIIIKRIRRKYGSFLAEHTRRNVEPTEKDVVKHIIFLDTPSSSLALLSGAVRIAQAVSVAKGHDDAWLEYAEHGIGVASGALGAYLFRPTRANLQHDPERLAQETIPEAVEDLMNLRQQAENG